MVVVVGDVDDVGDVSSVVVVVDMASVVVVLFNTLSIMSGCVSGIIRSSLSSSVFQSIGSSPW